MLKVAFTVLFFYVVIISSAERASWKTLQIGKTNIYLGGSGGSNIIDMKSKISIFVCGKNEQETLSKKNGYGYGIGELQRNSNGQKIDLKKGETIDLPKNIMVLQITEPRIIKEDVELENGFLYRVRRPNKRFDVYVTSEYKELYALLEAKKDLTMCYDTLLFPRLPGVYDEKNKCMGIMPLRVDYIDIKESADIALSAIREYITNNPESYLSIYILINRKKEYNAYRDKMNMIEKEITSQKSAS